MADNVPITAGTGTTIAADEVVDGTLGTVKVQFTKLMDGTLDSTNKAVVSAAGALKVDGSAVTQPVSGTVTSNQGTAAAVTAGWPTLSGQPADTTGSFTNATQTTSVTSGTINGYETVTVSISGTYATATGVFEVSDDAGTTWYAVQGARSDTSVIETGFTTLTNTSRMWVIPVTGADQFRVRSTAVASGTVSVRVSPTSAASADSAVVALGSALPTGSNVIGALTANQSVNAAQINGVAPLMGNGVTGTGSLRVTVASDNTAFTVNAAQATAANLNATVSQATGSNLHTVVDSGTITTVSTVTAVTGITNALPAGTNVLGHVINDASATAGGISTTARLPSAAASTNATNVKTTAGRIFSVSGKNNAAYDIFLVLYDAVTNPPVPGTTTIRKKIVCPASQAFVYDFPLGLSFASGIGYAFTKLVADADTTVLVAADITAFNMDYV